MVVCRFQGFVGTSLVCEGELTGVALPVEALQTSAANDDSDCRVRASREPLVSETHSQQVRSHGPPRTSQD